MKSLLKEKKKKAYVYQKIIDDIRDGIKSGKLVAGQWLAGEHEIARKYGISRMSARTGLKILKSEGLIESTAGMGIRIIGSKRRKLEDAMLIHSLSGALGTSISAYYFAIINVLRKRLKEKNLPMKIFLHESGESEEGLWRHTTFPKNMGVILLAETNPAALPDMKAIHGPVIQVDHCIPELDRDSVEFDSAFSGKLSVEHLCGLGCRNLAYIGWNDEQKMDPLKIVGINEALKKNKIHMDPELVARTAQEERDGYLAMKKLLDSGKKIDSVLTYSSPQVYGAYLSLMDAGIPYGKIQLATMGITFGDGKSPFAYIKPDYDDMAELIIKRLMVRHKNNSAKTRNCYAGVELVPASPEIWGQR